MTRWVPSLTRSPRDTLPPFPGFPLLNPVPTSATRFGLRAEGMGAHGSRTLMLAELRRLLTLLPADATLDAYRAVVVDENALLKGTVGTRNETFRRLRELYGLDPSVPLYRTLRALWDEDAASQPTLALLCALGRDPTLRATADIVLSASPGEPVTGARLGAAVREAWPTRYGVRSIVNIGRNTASTWTQSGHLRGRSKKERSAVVASPISATFALLLGYLCGARGEALFTTLWTRVLDLDSTAIRSLAFEASRQGWMEYRFAGGVTEVGFDHLLGQDRHP